MSITGISPKLRNWDIPDGKQIHFDVMQLSLMTGVVALHILSERAQYHEECQVCKKYVLV